MELQFNNGSKTYYIIGADYLKGKIPGYKTKKYTSNSFWFLSYKSDLHTGDPDDVIFTEDYEDVEYYDNLNDAKEDVIFIKENGLVSENVKLGVYKIKIKFKTDVDERGLMYYQWEYKDK